MTDQPARTWIEGADATGFGIRNIPFGVFSLGPGTQARAASRIGNYAVDLALLAKSGLMPAEAVEALSQPTLNEFMALGRPVWQAVRSRLQALFAAEDEAAADPALRTNESLRKEALLIIGSVTMQLPASIGDYTDFYSSRDHAYNVGVMIRGPANALQPNWNWLPVGYHGRASSVVVSGTDFKRPCGQLQADPADATKGAVYGPSKRMDFELELGTWIGPGNALGDAISVGQAEDHIFGMCIMNDWSARDVQTWEYVPLGPFGSKNFCTSVSPWVITLEALEPFRCATSSGDQNPPPLPYLADPKYGSWNVHLEVAIQPENGPASVITRSNYAHMYWNVRQQLAHHTVTGCNMRPGDLLGSGTISGPTPDSRGCMLELSWKGEKPIPLHNSPGETRIFLKDGDSVVMTGYAVDAATGTRIAFGECTGKVLPAAPQKA